MKFSINRVVTSKRLPRCRRLKLGVNLEMKSSGFFFQLIEFLLIIPGKRKGSKILFHKGFTYCKDVQSKRIFRCSKIKSGCDAYLKFLNPIGAIEECLDENFSEDEDYEIKNDHNHLEELYKDQWLVLIEIMKKRCRETTETLKEIYEDVCRPFPETSAQYTFKSCSSILARERHEYQGKIPETMSELGTKLLISNVAQGHVQCNGASSIIFTRDALLNLLNLSNDLLMDGTFENASRKPKIHQIYTLHVKFQNTYIAVGLILMEKRTTEMYNCVFKWFKEKAKKLEENKNLIILTDYEKATIKSLRENFPNAKIHGCYFHFAHAVIKMWVKLGVSTEQSFLSKILTIPLLPADRFFEAETILHNEIREKNYAATDKSILQFMNYLHKEWILKSDHVTVHECPTITTDGPESFHRSNFKKLGGKHPSINTLVAGIIKVLIDEETNYKRILTTAKKPKRDTPKFVIDRVNYIRTLKEEINKEKSRFDVAQFLMMVPRCLLELQKSLEILIGKDNEEMEMYHLAPEELDKPEPHEVNDGFEDMLNEVEKMIPPKFASPYFTNSKLPNKIITKSKTPGNSTFTSQFPAVINLNNPCSSEQAVQPSSHLNLLKVDESPITLKSYEKKITKLYEEDDDRNNLSNNNEKIIPSKFSNPSFRRRLPIQNRKELKTPANCTVTSQSDAPMIDKNLFSMSFSTSLQQSSPSEIEIPSNRKMFINGKELKIIPIDKSQISLLSVKKPLKPVTITVQSESPAKPIEACEPITEPKSAEKLKDISNQHYENHLKNIFPTFKKRLNSTGRPDSWLKEKKKRKKIVRKD